MKKLALFAVAAVAISFASCSGNGSSDKTTGNDSVPAPATPEVVAVENVNAVISDSAAIDSAQEVVEVAVDAVKK